MATITISGLPEAATVLDTSSIPLETNGITQRVTGLNLKAFLAALPELNATSGTVSGAFQSGSLTVDTNATVGGAITTNSITAGTGNFTTLTTTDLTVRGAITLNGNVAATNFLATQTISAPSVVATSSLSAPAIIKTGANGSGDIGQSTNAFGTVYATNFNGVATTAKYADLAEIYESDKDYEPGTVLSFGTTTEVTISSIAAGNKIAGVVSTKPAYLMNFDAKGIAVALTGRVPCKVIGLVTRGDMLVASNVPGVAMADAAPAIGTVIGKALGNHDSTEVGVIEVVVGRM